MSLIVTNMNETYEIIFDNPFDTSQLPAMSKYTLITGLPCNSLLSLTDDSCAICNRITLENVIENFTVSDYQELTLCDFDCPIHKNYINGVLFNCNHNNLISNEGIILRYPDCVDGSDKIIIMSGHIFDGNKWTIKSICVDHDNCCVIIPDMNNLKLPVNKCYLAVVHKCYRDKYFKLPTSFIPFSELPHFKIKSDDYVNIRDVLLNLSHNIDIYPIDKCRKLLITNPIESVKVNCTNGAIDIPVYLRPLFGQSPVFHIDGFGVVGKHDIDVNILELFRSWLLNLIINKTLPDVNELIQYIANIDDLAYAADYFNIPVFIDLFTRIKSVIDKN